MGVSPQTRSRHRPDVPDSVAARAVDLARAAAVQEAGADAVGAHLSVAAEDQRVVTHRFACLLGGYRGWEWAVTLSRVSRARVCTISEVVLLPGAGALLAPTWVPWSDRMRPGDLGVGFVVGTDAEDTRLAPGWSGEEELTGPLHDAPLHPVNWEPGIGRVRVPSEEGRRDAAHRWYGGDHGPHSPMAKASAGRCSTCGWMLLIGGPLGQMFGVCSHLLSPADGRVVSFDHGCGAHSETQPEMAPMPVTETVVDDLSEDILDFGHS